MIRLSISELRPRLKLIVFLFMMSFVQPMAAQDLDARSPKPMPLGREQKKADKKKAKQAAQLDKAIRKGRKQHEKLQSKQTKKMMKKSRKKSKRWNDNRREFFLKRWFAPRHRKADAGSGLEWHAYFHRSKDTLHFTESFFYLNCLRIYS